MPFEKLLQLLPAFSAVVLSVLGLFVVHRFILKGRQANPDGRFRNQLIMLALVLAAGVLIITVLPVSENLRGQLLSLVGILFSAAVALASTTLLGNAMAGIMLRAIRPFRPGYFIRVGDHFGRVTEMGLFHTEIQTEDRDLTTLPNLYLVTHAVKRVRPSGTMVSAEVSLGYDVPRARVEALLLEAAKQAGLGDPFVRILELLDHAVAYRVSGLLEEVTQLLPVRSNLRGAVLDALHGAGIEIVSPGFQNERQIPESRRFIPAPTPEPTRRDASELAAAEDEAVVFDKAEEAASLEALRERETELEEQIEAARQRAKATGTAEDEREVDRLKDRLGRLRRLVEHRAAEATRKE